MQTVNVIALSNDTEIAVFSFEDEGDGKQAGNEAAEAKFIEIAKAHGATDEDMDSFIEDGYHEQGTYQLFLVHSE